MNYVLESNIRVKSYDHSNFSRTSVVQFRASRYIISPNRTSVWKFMTIRICRVLPLFNFVRLDISFPCIRLMSEMLCPYEFSRASVVKFWASRWVMSPNRTSMWKLMTIRVKCYDHSNFSRASAVQLRASWYIMSPNRTSGWKVMTIRISRELPRFNFERVDILCPQIGHPCENLWPFEFLESFRCSISSVSIYNVPESDIRVKSYDNSNLLRASVVQFRAARYIMSQN